MTINVTKKPINLREKIALLDGLLFKFVVLFKQFAAFSSGPVAIIEDQKSIGTNGGTFTEAAWQHRELNTIVYNLSDAVSVSANQFTVKDDGWVEWSAPSLRTYGHQSRLYNVSDGVAVKDGTSERSDGTDVSVTSSVGGGPVEAGKTYRIEHQGSSTRSSTGFGDACGFATEVYTRVKLWKK